MDKSLSEGIGLSPQEEGGRMHRNTSQRDEERLGGAHGEGFRGGEGEGSCNRSRISSRSKSFNQQSGTVEERVKKSKEIVG